jgi:hypothetical protein
MRGIYRNSRKALASEGGLRWLGMLMSGEGGGGSQRGIAHKSQAMPLDVYE